jgi:hypothetical protein
MSTAPTPVDQHRERRHLQVTLTALAVLLLAAILAAVLVDRTSISPGSAGGTGSGVAATQARALPAFRTVELAGDNNVIVRVGATQSVVVHADSNLLARVTTKVRSGSLIIGTTSGSFNAKAPMFVTVSLPSIDAIRLQGAGNITVVGINSRSLIVALPGSGVVHATGATTHLAATIGGEGTALLSNLTARNASAAISGDGSIMLTATRSLRASISGSGTILYGGSPAQVNKSVTGSGTITGG